ncbi:MAG: hypothetical protein HY473_00875 [Candidatus Sungbacteria bacterium]|uniref:Helix-turn-helix domain-containing protein n=1 Tax=Candidatus Sungiibacteriota bacterium TaxID=2750080 RepID=A0A933DRY7_9BACT|nr:hypothetical protein [Candidatus Sungbacteria bacterium]
MNRDQSAILSNRGRPKGAVSPAERRRRFDARRWPGASEQLLSDAHSLGGKTIAQRFGFNSPQRAYQVIRYLSGNGKPRVPYFARLDATVEKILELVCDGKTMAEIASALHASTGTIASRLRYHRIILPRRAAVRKRPDITATVIRTIAEASCSISAIASQLKASPTTIIRWAKRYGITLPKGRHRSRSTRPPH